MVEYRGYGTETSIADIFGFTGMTLTSTSTHTDGLELLPLIKNRRWDYDYSISTQLSRGAAVAWWLGRLYPESPAVLRLRQP